MYLCIIPAQKPHPLRGCSGGRDTLWIGVYLTLGLWLLRTSQPLSLPIRQSNGRCHVVCNRVIYTYLRGFLRVARSWQDWAMRRP